MIEGLRNSDVHADPADWITVAAYSLASTMSLRAARAGVARERLFWHVTAALLLFFGGNELLDPQTLLTTIGREHAVANGWYEERRRA